ALLQVRLSVQALNYRLRKGAIAPRRVFQRKLTAGGSAKYHHAVLRRGQFVDEGVDVTARRSAESNSPVARTDKKQRLPGQTMEGIADVALRPARARQLFRVGVVRQKIILAVVVVHAVASQEHHAYIVRRDLMLQPLETIKDVVFRGFGIR